MSKIAEQEYLRNEQYKDASNFNARVNLHQRFSTNPYGWLRWVFDQLDLPAESRILEIGCGPGYLWAENAGRIPANWHITLSDFSEGMLREAQQNVSQTGHVFHFQVADAQALPFPDSSFDAVIANHMLYHVPDRERAYAEIKRVLQPAGTLFAATNGESHLRELKQIAAELGLGAWGSLPATTFLLEHGGQELERWFAEVELRRYPDSLVVTEAEPLVAFIVSMADTPVRDTLQQPALIAAVQTRIDQDGAINITKDAGLFIARRASAH